MLFPKGKRSVEFGIPLILMSIHAVKSVALPVKHFAGSRKLLASISVDMLNY